ncbi:fibrobacter succinogenes major paralogous domain-containing protein, partial [bacterium]|nr:fibrobacter succinogenes major paralogous domain-containing protein [bacterium]
TYLCENPGCMDPTADNYDPYAIEEDGSCVYSNGSPVCDFESAIYFDGYTYDLVAIGDQCWFAENLRNEHYANGDLIPGELSYSEWSNTSEGAQAIYANDGSNLADYGRLYNWYAVDDARGLCPSDWHVPTDGEFMTLEMELGMSESEANGTGFRGTDQGTQMKASASDSPSWDGTNTSGFSGLAGGYRAISGHFTLEGYDGYFWSASAGGADTWRRVLSGGSTGVSRQIYDYPRGGFSVRCVRD